MKRFIIVEDKTNYEEILYEICDKENNCHVIFETFDIELANLYSNAANKIYEYLASYYFFLFSRKEDETKKTK